MGGDEAFAFLQVRDTQSKQGPYAQNKRVGTECSAIACAAVMLFGIQRTLGFVLLASLCNTQLPHIMQSSGLSKLHAIASGESGSTFSLRSANFAIVSSLGGADSTVNWIASAAAFVRR